MRNNNMKIAKRGIASNQVQAGKLERIAAFVKLYTNTW